MRDNNTKPGWLNETLNEKDVPLWQRFWVSLAVWISFFWLVFVLLGISGFVVIWLGLRRHEWHLVSVGLYLWVPLGLLILLNVCMTAFANFSHFSSAKAFLDEKPPDPMLENALIELRNRTPKQIAETRARILAASRPTAPLPPGSTLDDMLFSTWPGNETDEQIKAALEELA